MSEWVRQVRLEPKADMAFVTAGRRGEAFFSRLLNVMIAPAYTIGVLSLLER